MVPKKQQARRQAQHLEQPSTGLMVPVNLNISSRVELNLTQTGSLGT